MIGRLYAVNIGNQAQTAAKNLVEIASPADAVTVLERAYISQSSFDTSEMLGGTIRDIATTGTGTASVPRPNQEGDAAFGGVVETNSSIDPTYGTPIFYQRGFNVLTGFEWVPATDDEFIVISPSQLLGLRLDVAPSASMNFSYGVTIREIGG